MQTVEDLIGRAAEIPAQAWVAAAVTAVLALGLAAWPCYRAWRAMRRHPIEESFTIAAAVIASTVSAMGMWRFFGDVLGLSGPLRLLLFAFIEIAVITSGVRARRSMRENYSAGVDGLAVWALAALSAVLSAMDARSLAEAIFRLAAPLVAAWLWERGMAIERRRITGRGSIHWRLTPERVMVRLGLAEASDRTASEVDAHRRLTRVARAAKRARALREAGASPKKVARAMARLDRAMDAAVEHAGIARDRTRQHALLDQITALYGTPRLLDLIGQAPWEHLDHPANTGLMRDSEALVLAAALDRHTALHTWANVAPQPRPDASGRRLDGPEPTESDKRRVVEYWIKKVKEGQVLGKYKLAQNTGFRTTWCGDRIAEARALLAAQGWTFDKSGNPISPEGGHDTPADAPAGDVPEAPPALVQEPATGPITVRRIESVNGSAPVAADA